MEKLWAVEDSGRTWWIKEWWTTTRILYKFGWFYTSDGSGNEEDWAYSYPAARKQLLTSKKMKRVENI